MEKLSHPQVYQQVLEEAAKGCNKVCEIGMGASTDYLCKHAKQVWSIDTRFGGKRHPNLTFINWTSLEVSWDIEVDLLYVDGNHTEEHVALELAIYGPWVRQGGRILLDDAVNNPLWANQVSNAIEAFCDEHGVKWHTVGALPTKFGLIEVTQDLSQHRVV